MYLLCYVKQRVYIAHRQKQLSVVLAFEKSKSLDMDNFVHVFARKPRCRPIQL